MDKVRQLSGGVNQSGVRAHNERLILTTLHRHGALPGSEIARRTGLSSQTVSVILRKLEGDGLLARGQSVRGRVGKPSVPMGIHRDGLLSYGLKLGRRSADLVLMDALGGIRSQKKLRYGYPMPDVVFGFLRDSMQEIEAGLERRDAARICGIGIGAPFEMWNWHEQIGAPRDAFQVWRALDFAAEISGFSSLPVFAVNDATAACRAEQMFGRGKAFRDYAYFFLGAFIGGGVVLNHSVFEGRSGNAGALGSLPVLSHDGTVKQLLDVASIQTLENRLTAHGLDSGRLWDWPQDWSGLSAAVAPWIDAAAQAIAQASLAACAVIDFEAVLIDGALPVDVREKLVEAVRARIVTMESRGLILPSVEAGAIGANARAIGAACGPVISQFLLDTNVGLGRTA